MKKIFLFIILTASIIYAQNDKGNISFTFNGEKINLPITTVAIMKQNNITVTARAEHNDSKIQQVVSLEMGFKKLAFGDSLMAPLIRININLRDNTKQTGNDLSIQYDKQGLSSGNRKNERAHYGVFSKGERVSWDITTLSLTFNVEKVGYFNKHLKIFGAFSGKFSSTIAPKGKFAEIKDGKFEIII